MSVLPRFLPAIIVGVCLLALIFLAGEYSSSLQHPELKTIASHSEWTYEEFSEYFESIAREKGALYGFDILLEAELPPSINVHLIGHLLGTALYEEKGIDAIRFCTQDFRNACSHSVAIAIFRDYGEGGLATITDVCHEAPGGPGAYTMCFHGLGHGVLAYTGYNLEKAIDLCRKTGTPAYQNREFVECIGGTIMELDSGFHNKPAWEAMAPLYYNREDVLAPCTTLVPEEARGICYTYLTPHLFRRAGIDVTQPQDTSFAKAFSFCELIPEEEKEQRDGCYGGFGKEFVGLAKMHDIRDVGSMGEDSLRKVRGWCTEAGTPDGEKACHEQALAALYWGGENKPDASFNYCALAETKEGMTACYGALTERIILFAPDSIAKTLLCARLPAEYRAACTEGRNL